MLDLEINQNNKIQDMMSSSKYFGDNRGAYDEMEKISKLFYNSGFKILRKKIETVPWHPIIEESNTETISNSLYFESHLQLLLQNENDLSDELLEQLQKMVPGKLKKSKNIFKKIDNGFIKMLTLRNNKTNYQYFKNGIEQILKRTNFKDIKI